MDELNNNNHILHILASTCQMKCLLFRPLTTVFKNGRNITAKHALIPLFQPTIHRRCNHGTNPNSNSNLNSKTTDEKTIKSEKEWQEILTENEFYIMRQKGTEPKFSGTYGDHFIAKHGYFACKACNNVNYSCFAFLVLLFSQIRTFFFSQIRSFVISPGFDQE